MTIPEINLLVKAQNEQQEQQIYLTHLGGNLNLIAHYDPKHFPRYEKLLPKKSVTRKRREEADNQAMERDFSNIGIRPPLVK